jgi:hypothetical protein
VSTQGPSGAWDDEDPAAPNDTETDDETADDTDEVADPDKSDETIHQRYMRSRAALPRPKTVNVANMRRDMRREARAEPEAASVDSGDLDELPPRPRVRGDCENGLRPCPYVSCKYHLYLDIGSNGSMKMNFPDRDPTDLTETCALDIADVGGATLEDVGVLMNLTRERVRQVEVKALVNLLRTAREDATRARRRLPLIDPDTFSVLDGQL